MNIPYVKQYNEKGEHINPIKGAYINQFDNRKKRREVINIAPFYGESKNYHLTICPSGKYFRHKQAEVDKTGKIKFIEHYLLKK